jgi:ribosome-binding protein aMBF1 (putative translation factor)
MTDAETNAGDGAHTVCERCDRESRHLTKWLDPDGSEHYVCWSCLQRTEKRVNLSQRWKRERRGDATAR